jgi:hypothetical protein
MPNIPIAHMQAWRNGDAVVIPTKRCPLLSLSYEETVKIENEEGDLLWADDGPWCKGYKGKVCPFFREATCGASIDCGF